METGAAAEALNQQIAPEDTRTIHEVEHGHSMRHSIGEETDLNITGAGCRRVRGSEGSKIVALVWKHRGHRNMHRVLVSEQE